MYRKTNRWSSHSQDIWLRVLRDSTVRVSSMHRARKLSNFSLVITRWRKGNLLCGNWRRIITCITLIPDLLRKSQGGRDSRVHWDWPVSYVDWYDPKHLDNAPNMLQRTSREVLKQNEKPYKILQDEMWQEYYRPYTLSSIQKIFSYSMNSTLRTFHPRSPIPRRNW